MIREDCDETKQSHWTELEIRGPIRNLSPELWTFTHLTALFLNDNNLQVNVIREGGGTRGERREGERRKGQRWEGGRSSLPLSLPSGLLLFSLPPLSSSLSLLSLLLSPSSLFFSPSSLFFSLPLLSLLPSLPASFPPCLCLAFVSACTQMSE